MAEFKADLNPKNNSMSLYDLVKMSEYIGAGKAKVAKPAPVIDKSTPYKIDDMLKSDPNDIGTQFRFNNNQQD